MSTPDQDILRRWQDALAELRPTQSSQTWETWFQPLSLLRFDGKSLMIGVPSSFFAKQFDDLYLAQLYPLLQSAFGGQVRILYSVPRKQQDTPTDSAESESNISLPAIDPCLNADFTFDNFVRGAANKIAHAIALSIAERPDQYTFNPWFLYGASGVGKTHLVSALGNRYHELFPHKRTLYVPANIFLLQYTDAAKQGKQNDFIHFYQKIDLLIIDDFQEITTAKTQQAFFHIFNHLQQNRRKIVITSDRAPADFEGIEERMLSRLKWGTTTEIERPDIALRKAILQSKIRRAGLSFPRDVINFIAENVSDNVRDLQGAINSILAYSFDESGDITVDLARRCVARIVNITKKELSYDNIVAAVCKYSGIRKSDITGKSRKKEIVAARQLALHIAHKYTAMSFSQLGRAMGGRDHSTVMHACNQVEARLAADKAFRKSVETLEASIKQ